MSRRSDRADAAAVGPRAGLEGAKGAPAEPARGNFSRRLVFFVLMTCTIHIVLSLPWPGIKRAYARAHAAAVTVVFGSFDGGRVRMEPYDGDPNKDSKLILSRPGSSVSCVLTYTAWYCGYQPTVMVLALTLATPLPWRRRLRAVAIGLVLVHVFVALHAALAIAIGFAADCSAHADGGWAIYHPSPFGRAMLGALAEVATRSPTATYLTPVIIWAIATVRRRDIEWFWGGSRGPDRGARTMHGQVYPK